MYKNIIVLMTLLLATNLFALAKKEKVSDFNNNRQIIDAWLDKEEYLIGEDVILNIRFINNSDDKLILPDPYLENSFYRNMNNSKGFELRDQFVGWYVHLGIRTRLIMPHDTIIIHTPINLAYQITDSLGLRLEMPADKYSYTLKYPRYYEEKKFSSSWKETFTFSIKEPTGQDYEAMQLYLKAKSLKFGNKLSRNEGIKLLDEIITIYPSSIYAPLAIHTKLKVLCSPGIRVANPEIAIELCKVLIEKYPEFRTGSFLETMKTAYYQKNKTEEYKEYLNNIMVKTTNKELKLKIEEQLRRLESENEKAWQKYYKGEGKMPITKENK